MLFRSVGLVTNFQLKLICTEFKGNRIEFSGLIESKRPNSHWRFHQESSRNRKAIVFRFFLKKDKKYVATFKSPNGRLKSVHFGAKGYQNYGGVGKERHLSEERKKRYIKRHKGKENWNDPTTAGSLSRWILWHKKSFREGVKAYKKRFNLK